MQATPTAFDEYHRRRRRAATPRRAAAALVAAATVGAIAFGFATAPPQPAQAAQTDLATIDAPTTADPGTGGAATASPPAPTAVPAQAVTKSAAPRAVAPAARARAAVPAQALGTIAVTATPRAPFDAYVIDVTATGYQREIDECQWVRMDLGLAEPIVGAHTSCGGASVLSMSVGQAVRLRGQSLDGRYRVTGSRDARGGENAGDATRGLVATVLLQTCYPGGTGRERLVTLVALR